MHGKTARSDRKKPRPIPKKIGLKELSLKKDGPRQDVTDPKKDKTASRLTVKRPDNFEIDPKLIRNRKHTDVYNGNDVVFEGGKIRKYIIFLLD